MQVRQAHPSPPSLPFKISLDCEHLVFYTTPGCISCRTMGQMLKYLLQPKDESLQKPELFKGF